MPHPAIATAPTLTTDSTPTHKRAAPISASAFTFSLGKKSRAPPLPVAGPSSNTRTAPGAPARPPPVQTPTPARRKDAAVLATPRAGTPLRSILDIRTPHRPYSPSNEPIPLSDPDNPSIIKKEVERSDQTPKRKSIIKPLNAFQTPDKRPSGGDFNAISGGNSSARRIAASAFSLNVPSRSFVEDDGRPKKPLQAITLAKSESVADDLLRRRKRELLDGDGGDEGIGVSPRGKKIMKWTGKGAIPPSVRLANLLSSTNASLQLFHTAMEYTLYPSHKSRVTAARPHSNITSDTSTLTSLPPTPFQHIHSAPIRLRLKSHVKGATHHSVYFHCELLASTSSEVEVTLGEEVLVAFQTIPPECPRSGLDPRLLVHKIGTADKSWQVGIWAWTEIDIPVTKSDGDNGQEEEVDDSGIAQMRKTVLATRYLVVEEEVQTVNDIV